MVIKSYYSNQNFSSNIYCLKFLLAEINKGSEKVKISPVISASLITEFVDGIYKCELITNNKEKCVFFDLNNEEIEREEATVKCPAIGFTRGNGCTLHLSDRSIASTGTWRVYTYFNNSNGADRWVNEYEVFMEEVKFLFYTY